MKKKKEEKIEEECLLADTSPDNIDSLWALLIIFSLFWQPTSTSKIININMGDDK